MPKRKSFPECLSSWGLKKNPFGERYPYAEGFWARPRDKIEFLEYLLENAANQKEVLNILLRGEYGSGKTYALRYLKDFVERKLSGFGIYFLIPSKYIVRGFRDILAEFMKQIGIENLARIGNEIAKEKEITSAGELREFLVGFPLDVDLATSISNIAFGKDYALTSTWLYGASTVYQNRALGMQSSTRDESTAIRVISETIDLLSSRYSIVAVLIDELENLAGASRAIRSIREGFRNLYDTLIYEEKRGSIAVFSAVTARLAFEIQSTMGTALLDRVDHEVVFEPLNDEECENFILELLRFARDSEEPAITPPFANRKALIKFIKELPKSVVTLTRGAGKIRTPRRIVKAGDYLLKRACFEGKEKIDAKFVEEVLARRL